MSDWPWNRMDLDPATATERDVKRAYARLIKVHRPDTDPQGFREVHEAYQAALTWLREAEGDEAAADENVFYPILETRASAPPVAGTAEPAVPEAMPDPPPRLHPPFVAESEFSPALKQLVAAFLAALPLRSQRGAHKAYQAIEHYLQDHPAEVALLDATFYQQLRQATGSLAKFLTPQRLLSLVQREAFDTAELMLQRWHLTRRGAELRTFLKLFLRQPTTVEHRASLDFQLKLAEMAVFIDCDRAEQLTNRIFPHLSLAQRKHQLATFEARAAVAKIFAVLPLRDRLFWETKFYPTDDEAPLFDRRVTRRFYKNATTICPSSWPGWNLLEQVVPQRVLNPRRWQILTVVSRPRFCGFRQSDWRHITVIEHLKRMVRDTWRTIKRIGLLMAKIVGGLAALGLLNFLISKCVPTPPPTKSPRSEVIMPERVPLPRELETAKGEYQLDQLLLAKMHLEQELEALPGYDAWRQARYAGNGPPGAKILIAQKSQVDNLIAKARARKPAPVLVQPK